MPHAAKGPFCSAGSAAESNSAPFAALHLNGVCRWISQLLLRGSFSKRSTARRVNGSNGSTSQWVTFTFTILYMIADDARLTPPRCKKHTAYDDTTLTPHHCKKHTASFARSTGKFPSRIKMYLPAFHTLLPFIPTSIDNQIEKPMVAKMVHTITVKVTVISWLSFFLTTSWRFSLGIYEVCLCTTSNRSDIMNCTIFSDSVLISIMKSDQSQTVFEINTTRFSSHKPEPQFL